MHSCNDVSSSYNMSQSTKYYNLIVIFAGFSPGGFQDDWERPCKSSMSSDMDHFCSQIGPES